MSHVDLERKVAWIYGNQAMAGRDIHVSLDDTALEVLKRQVGKHPVRRFVSRANPIAAATAR